MMAWLQERIWHEVEGAQGAAAALLYRSYTRRSAKLRFRAVWKHWQMLWYAAHTTRFSWRNQHLALRAAPGAMQNATNCFKGSVKCC